MKFRTWKHVMDYRKSHTKENIVIPNIVWKDMISRPFICCHNCRTRIYDINIWENMASVAIPEKCFSCEYILDLPFRQTADVNREISRCKKMLMNLGHTFSEEFK